MPVGAKLGWSVEDGRDVLAYVQTLETGREMEQPAGVGQGAQPNEGIGGPSGLGAGILTGLAAFLGTIGGAVVFIVILLAIGVGVVVILRKRD